MNNTKKNIRKICSDLEVNSIDILEMFPLYFMIETIALCNAKCTMCPRSFEDPVRNTFVMSQELKQKIVSDLKPFSNHIRRVTVQGYGEPLLDKELPQLIFDLKKIGIKEVFFSTNASLLNREMAIDLLNSGVDQIDFSIDAYNQKTYETIRPPLILNEVIDNILLFLSLRKSMNKTTRVRFRYVLQGFNDHEYPQFYEFWENKISDDDIIYSKKLHSFGSKISTVSKNTDFSDIPCYAIFGTFVIQSDGVVPVCSMDVSRELPSLAGDVNNESIHDIWQGEVFKSLRNMHLQIGRNAHEKCTTCDSYSPFLKH